MSRYSTDEKNPNPNRLKMSSKPIRQQFVCKISWPSNSPLFHSIHSIHRLSTAHHMAAHLVHRMIVWKWCVRWHAELWPATEAGWWREMRWTERWARAIRSSERCGIRRTEWTARVRPIILWCICWGNIKGQEINFNTINCVAGTKFGLIM